MLLDTSTLLRFVQPSHPHNTPAVSAIEILRRQDEPLQIVPQNLYEFWVVATRPFPENGLGLTVSAALGEIERLRLLFDLMPDIPEIYDIWQRLVVEHRVSGKPAHDARLVAAMLAHGITSILTFDTRGFERYPEIETIHPASVTS